MESLYLCKNADELTKLKVHADAMMEGLVEYLKDLRKYMRVEELPKCIIWTQLQTATELLANVPVPAYTDERRTVVVPYPDVWKAVYLKQLEAYGMDRKEVQETRMYYEHIPMNKLRQILGHEFVHWSEFFRDELYERSIWFEEGLAEYVSRKWFLNPAEYAREKYINQLLVSLYEEEHGEQSLDTFTYEVYEKGMTTIFYYYWKSFLFMEQLIERQSGNMGEVIQCYQRWCETNREVSLLDWFLIK